MRTLQQLYGDIRKFFGWTRYIVIPMYFEDGVYWLVYDSYAQVHINGSMAGSEHGAWEILLELVHPSGEYPAKDKHAAT